MAISTTADDDGRGDYDRCVLVYIIISCGRGTPFVVDWRTNPWTPLIGRTSPSRGLTSNASLPRIASSTRFFNNFFGGYTCAKSHGCYNYTRGGTTRLDEYWSFVAIFNALGIFRKGGETAGRRLAG